MASTAKPISLSVELTSELCRGLIPATKNRGDYFGTSGVAISPLGRMTIDHLRGAWGAGGRMTS
jgi:hypothetical protein